MRRLALWLVCHGPRLPDPVAAWLFGLAIGVRGQYVGRYVLFCEVCGQSSGDKGGEYPCRACGRPTLHDEQQGAA